MDKMKKCAFGVLREGIAPGSIAGCFKRRSGLKVTVKILGGEYVLVVFEFIAAMKACVQGDVPWLGEYFLLLKEWESKDSATHRVCWLNIYGTPPHAWCEDFFRQITGRIGKFVRLPNDFDCSSNMEIARVQILTPFKEPIFRRYRALIGDRCFELSVFEVQSPVSDRDGLDEVGDRHITLAPVEENQQLSNPFRIVEVIRKLEKGKMITNEAPQKGVEGRGQMFLGDAPVMVPAFSHARLSCGVSHAAAPSYLSKEKVVQQKTRESYDKVKTDGYQNQSDKANILLVQKEAVQA
ncbi:hypothetical protein Tsubulata_037571 [Turnera subulata]|uniref:DUF4283 domain-containing protein n=1 Tax=Turnera subulata TaxID=218843 RepID=A0A9Q0FX16_9ROSI|nr:hypothetical protein Tsubulata_037571 [Turnera subulata]